MNDKPLKLQLRLPDVGGPAVWDIDLANDDAVPERVDPKSYPDGVTLGDSNTASDPYRFDLSELATTMEVWLRRRRQGTGSGGDSNADTSGSPEGVGLQAGPHDVVLPVVRTVDGSKRLVFRLVRNDFTWDESASAITSVRPKEVVTVTAPGTCAAMRALVRSGTILMFLHQTTFPIGVTCYLLNLLALEADPEYDPDRLG